MNRRGSRTPAYAAGSAAGSRWEGTARGLVLVLIVGVVPTILALVSPLAGLGALLVCIPAEIALSRKWRSPGELAAERQAQELAAKLEQVSRAARNPDPDFVRKLDDQQRTMDRYGGRGSGGVRGI